MTRAAGEPIPDELEMPKSLQILAFPFRELSFLARINPLSHCVAPDFFANQNGILTHPTYAAAAQSKKSLAFGAKLYLR